MKKQRQYRSTQGRSPEQLESNYKIAFWSIIGLVIFVIALIIESNI